LNVEGKQIVVTGGARGLGFAMVEKFVSKGANVTVLDADEAALSVLLGKLAAVTGTKCDVSDPADVSRAAATFHEHHRAADVVVNNAGILHSAPLLRLSASGVERHDLDAWSKVLAVNLTSVFLVTSAFAERMLTTRTKGVIVNISSVSATGNAGQSAYSAAKAGVNALTATWAKELGPMGIRVVAIAPGFTDTESTHAAVSEATLKETVARVPLRRLGRAEEIAHAVLCAVEADFFNGKVWAVDGGLVP
jgi:3-oxoacyl-[acyl-carrier protein] reductase